MLFPVFFWSNITSYPSVPESHNSFSIREGERRREFIPAHPIAHMNEVGCRFGGLEPTLCTMKLASRTWTTIHIFKRRIWNERYWCNNITFTIRIIQVNQAIIIIINGIVTSFFSEGDFFWQLNGNITRKIQSE